MSWSFLANHARVLLCTAHDLGVRLRDTAASVGITERSAYGIVTVHGSSSPESGARQIKIFFSELVYRSAPAGE